MRLFASLAVVSDVEYNKMIKKHEPVKDTAQEFKSKHTEWFHSKTKIPSQKIELEIPKYKISKNESLFYLLVSSSGLLLGLINSRK